MSPITEAGSGSHPAIRRMAVALFNRNILTLLLLVVLVSAMAPGRAGKKEIKIFTKSAVEKVNKKVRSSSRRKDAEEVKLLEDKDKSPPRSTKSDHGRRVISELSKTKVKAIEKKKRRAVERQKKNVKRLRASMGEISILERASVGKSETDYERRHDEFLDFAARYVLPLKKTDQLDVALVEFCDHLYMNGEDSTAGDKLKASVEYYSPDYSRHGVLRLPRFAKSRKGWKKLSPAQTRLPALEEHKLAITGDMMHRGKKEMALYNETTYSTYGRPGEMLKLTVEDFVPTEDTTGYPVLILHPMERDVSSKVGIFDETVLLDDKEAEYIPVALELLVKQRIKEDGEEALLWGFTASEYLAGWRLSVSRLKLASFLSSPYQNRHGGASRDHLKKLRTPLEVKRRGRWSSDSAARIYDKPGRMQQMKAGLDPKLKKFSDYVKQHFVQLYRGSLVKVPPKLASS